MTYSIVARDPLTGELGVAVQSHFFSVGPTVVWTEAGVGAVATQSLVLPAYGPRGLDRMRAGASAPEALAILAAEDDGREVRQVAMVDAAGRIEARTGTRCIAHAGQVVGEGYSCQANMMRRTGVPEAMATAYESASGSLLERLVAALVAAEAAGGDVRGRQSSAVRVVQGAVAADTWDGLVADLRVDDHPDPNTELQRLVRLHLAYRHLQASENARLAGDLDDAKREAEAAIVLAPENVELGYWWAIELVKLGRDGEARPLLDRAFTTDSGWRELVPRLVLPGIIPDDPALIERILNA